MSIANVYAEGRLIRGKWSATDAEGRQLLCLYTALVGDPEGRPDACPASIAPKWIAHLVPWWDDAGSEAAWAGMVVRVARIAGRLHEVPARAEWQCRAIAVREAMRHTDAALAWAAAAAEAARAAAKAAVRAASAQARAAPREAAAAAADRMTDAMLAAIERSLAVTRED